MNYSRLLLAPVLSVALCTSALAGGSLVGNGKDGAVTFIKPEHQQPDVEYQHRLRNNAKWQAFLAKHGTWYVTFNEANAKPHNAFGKPIPTSGADAESRARNFIAAELEAYAIPANELELQTVNETEKHTIVIFNQRHQNLDVLFSRLMIKMLPNGDVIQFTADVYNQFDLDFNPTYSAVDAQQLAGNGLVDPVVSASFQSDLKVLPTQGDKETDAHLVYEITVNTLTEDKIPGEWLTYVDAHTGDVLYRQNLVMFYDEHEGHDHGDAHDPHKKSTTAAINLTVEAPVTDNVLDPSTVRGLPYAEVTIGGMVMNADENGVLNTADNNPVMADFRLRSPFVTMLTGATGNNFSVMNQTINPGTSTASWLNEASDAEISVYYHTNIVHDVMKDWTPAAFTNLDFPIQARVDRGDDECNAFYNGGINFYSASANCPNTGLFHDVVYHEYGHGINRELYSFYGGFFGNGALNEGYADVWGFRITNNPVLGLGFRNDPNSFVRRYDIDPKIFPEDLVGQVHADGEIIAGAWWDLSQDIGMDEMFTIFMGTMPAVHSAAAGNEGELYTDVLVEALLFDDDDGDITNGTPNGNAIAEHFDAHGITLLSNATLVHVPEETKAPLQDITIDASLQLAFPFTNYLDDVVANFRINNGPLQTLPLNNTSGNDYQGIITGQPFGTLIAYYVGVNDIFGNSASVQPFAVDKVNPTDANIPYFIMVGFQLEKTQDGDDNEELGTFQTGVSDDNATTGQWQLNIPLGSFTDPNDPSTVVAPDMQHTPGGEFCYLTGRANLVNDPVGTNDVDGGKTTLRSPVIDLSTYVNPTFTYWRWYDNSPATGANPGADWFQAFISDDAGASWEPVDVTLQSDGSWRRFAFRVQDHVNITSQFQMQFVVSDSIRPGQNLDGGSLVESAIDDIQLWDNADPNSVSENQLADIAYSLFPNPARDQMNLRFVLPEAEAVTMTINNYLGQTIKTQDLGVLASGRQETTVDIQGLSSGVYTVSLRIGKNQYVRRLSVVD